jgi:putative methyltransferase (TIGR04325 family)
MSLRGAIKELLPPAALRVWRRFTDRGIRFEGDYRSWREAQQVSGGYDRAEILRKVYEAELKVKQGKAADARDGVLFDTVQFSLPVMAALGRIACGCGRPLRVIDFGGAFGGLYRQYKAFGLPAGVFWTVIEQASLVSVGRDTFENEELRFSPSIEKALASGTPDVVLFSSVLQYLENPGEIIRKISDARVPHVVIDRTPCFDGERNLLTVQRVPPEIYEASYPCWIFSRPSLLRALEPNYRLVAAFTDSTGPMNGPGLKFDLGGFMFDRKN